MIPSLLNDDQKEYHMQVCQDMIECHQTEPDLLYRVSTSDEIWIYKNDLETKYQSSQ